MSGAVNNAPAEEGWSFSDVGHAALDIAGLIPVYGEPADLANAAWYANEEKYLESGLSLISLVPVVGDAVGKGGKIATKIGGPVAAKAVKAIKALDVEKALGRFRSHPQLGPKIDKIIAAVKDWQARLLPCGKLAPPPPKTYDMVNPGPLADDLAGTFAGGKYQEVVLQEDKIMRRVGDAKQPFGRFFSDESAQGVLQTRMDRAILPQWASGAKSPIDTEFEILIPKGTKVYVGEIGSQGGIYVGGKQQTVIPAPWSVPGVKILSSKPLK